jgi:translation initiation factor 1 (eIF-1/SUI1)
MERKTQLQNIRVNWNRGLMESQVVALNLVLVTRIERRQRRGGREFTSVDSVDATEPKKKTLGKERERKAGDNKYSLSF